MSDFKRMSIGFSIPNADLTEEQRKVIDDVIASQEFWKAREARLIAGCPNEDDKKYLEEQSKYCHECGRPYEEIE